MKKSIPHLALATIAAAILSASLPAYAQTAVTTTSHQHHNSGRNHQ